MFSNLKKINFISFLAIFFLFCEIATFIIVGSFIGVIPTISLIALFMMIGILTLRNNSASFFYKLKTMNTLNKPQSESWKSNFLSFFVSILLIIPGFITTIIALLLWNKKIRSIIFSFFARYINLKQDDSIIDLEKEEYYEKKEKKSFPSKNAE